MKETLSNTGTRDINWEIGKQHLQYKEYKQISAKTLTNE